MCHLPLTSSLLHCQLQDQIITQRDVQGATAGHDSMGQDGAMARANSAPHEEPEKSAQPNAMTRKESGSYTWGQSKKKLPSDGVENQAGSFTKQLEGYLPRFHWHNQQQAALKSQKKKAYAMCLNLRDVGANMPALMKPGIVFRSSELLRCLAAHPLSDSQAPPYMCFSCVSCLHGLPVGTLHPKRQTHAPVLYSQMQCLKLTCSLCSALHSPCFCSSL